MRSAAARRRPDASKATAMAGHEARASSAHGSSWVRPGGAWRSVTTRGRSFYRSHARSEQTFSTFGHSVCRAIHDERRKDFSAAPPAQASRRRSLASRGATCRASPDPPTERAYLRPGSGRESSDPARRDVTACPMTEVTTRPPSVREDLLRRAVQSACLRRAGARCCRRRSGSRPDRCRSSPRPRPYAHAAAMSSGLPMRRTGSRATTWS